MKEFYMSHLGLDTMLFTENAEPFQATFEAITLNNRILLQLNMFGYFSIILTVVIPHS